MTASPTEGGATVDEVVERQRRYFKSGETLGRSFRAAQLITLRDAIQRFEGELYEALWSDLHKGRFETYTSEIGFVYEEIRHARRRLKRWMRPRRVSTPIVHAPARSRVHYRPLGVSAVMAPWNYPFQLAIAPVVASIAAGNCTIVKPSEQAPACAEVTRRLIADAFRPEYLTCVVGEADTAAELTRAPVDHIFFTGSTRVGREVMRTAAERLVPVTLELGGKSPAVVTESAPIEVTARRLVWGKVLNAGQTCVAPDYAVVHRSVADDLLKAIERELTRFFPEGAHRSDDYGRIVNDAHFRRLSELMKRQSEDGAGDAVIGGDVDAAERFIRPTVYYPAAWDDPVMEDELFGPILPVIPYDDFDHAISRVASLPKPLSAYLFTGDTRVVRTFEERLPFGGATINDTIVHLANPELPFGGVGASGMGGYHGFAGFEAFSHRASVMHRGTRLDVRLKYPPYGDALKIVRRLMRP